MSNTTALEPALAVSNEADRLTGCAICDGDDKTTLLRRLSALQGLEMRGAEVIQASPKRSGMLRLDALE